MSENSFKVISLFSGAMGLDIGLEKTKLFETRLCLDVASTFCATIEHNRNAGRTSNPNMVIVNEDIRTIDKQKLLQMADVEPGELDLVSGGPPCQAFSVFGKRRGIDDVRGQLVFEFINFVEVLQPKTFIMENVRGLLSMGTSIGAPKGSLFREIQARFNDIGYRTDCFVVNSANYGAPQIRERVIVIGNRFNLEADFPAPTHSNRPEDRLKQFAVLGDAIQGRRDPDPTIMDFSPRKKNYLAMVPPGGNWRSLPIEIQKESMGKAFYLKGGRSAYWRKLSYDFPCPTIVTMPNHAGTSLCHPEELRPLTVGECSLIQGFPEDWIFVGSPSEKYQQVGNAVPIVLGEVAGQALGELLVRINNLTKPENTKLLPDRIIHLRPHVRTRWWWKDGEIATGLSYTERPKAKNLAKNRSGESSPVYETIPMALFD